MGIPRWACVQNVVYASHAQGNSSSSWPSLGSTRLTFRFPVYPPGDDVWDGRHATSGTSRPTEKDRLLASFLPVSAAAIRCTVGFCRTLGEQSKGWQLGRTSQPAHLVRGTCFPPPTWPRTPPRSGTRRGSRGSPACRDQRRSSRPPRDTRTLAFPGRPRSAP
jgi:hypothetical protein